MRRIGHRNSQTFDGPNWAFSAIQVSGYLRFIRPSAGGNSSWAQIGAGLYRLNRNLADPDWTDATILVIGRGPQRIMALPGFQGGGMGSYQDPGALAQAMTQAHQRQPDLLQQVLGPGGALSNPLAKAALAGVAAMAAKQIMGGQMRL